MTTRPPRRRNSLALNELLAKEIVLAFLAHP